MSEAVNELPGRETTLMSAEMTAHVGYEKHRPDRK
jgi:hypothetical protein